MLFRRGCLVALSIGVAVVGCGEAGGPARARKPVVGQRAVRTPPQEPRTTKGPDPAPTPPPDVTGALTALSAAIRVLAPHSRLESAQTAVAVPDTQMSATEPCGGDLPPCWVVENESGGDYGAVNPTGCGGLGCFGRYQFSGAWAGHLGLPADLRTATPEQQDAAARLLWDHGRGCAHWASCG